MTDEWKSWANRWRDENQRLLAEREQLSVALAAEQARNLDRIDAREAAELYSWLIAARLKPPADVSSCAAVARALHKLTEIAGDLIAWEPLDLDDPDDPEDPVPEPPARDPKLGYLGETMPATSINPVTDRLDDPLGWLCEDCGSWFGHESDANKHSDDHQHSLALCLESKAIARGAAIHRPDETSPTPAASDPTEIPGS